LPFSTWSLHKLAAFLVAEGVVEDISHEARASCILPAHGDCNLAAALRRNARDATRVLPLLGVTSR
jgi:hypothetical protein